MNQSEPEWVDKKQEQPVETGSIPAAFNTFQKYSDHHPHQSRYLSKKEEEGTGESSHGDSFEADKQQQLHSISNNFSVNSKSDTTQISVYSTSSTVVESNGAEKDNLINQVHHHHHHHHYHHHYHYKRNTHQGDLIL